MEDGDTSGQAALSWQQGQNMMVALSDVVVPFGVTRIPKWLGKAKEGKMKASEWCSLFSIYLPLAAIDTLVGDIEKYLNKPQEAANLCQLVDNFCSLVGCTHILEAQSITKPDCVQFGQEYQKYSASSSLLFPGYVVNPNHHYALHIKMQLKWWEPLRDVAKLAWERLNGILQQIPTSGKIGKGFFCLFGP
ncbi:hypothetical protein O181_090713 [Austropuccinia psidii MF-1]|uniref:Uncharacterized protein n=1 Tax=Austropuccinia psidii MF-1 TaxID=1389203 RepID=A0A9Q3P6T4_9BASI|nr:hypothetical protein [Austropuccinia psidii MF-1]